MPKKDSTAIGVRIDNEVISEIRQKASRRGLTFNRWINLAIKEGLRKHTKKDKTAT